MVDADRRGECSAAVHDAMSYGLEPVPALLRKPGEELAQKVLMAEVGPTFLKSFVDDCAASRLPRRQTRGDPDLLDLAAEKLPQLSTGLCLPQGELETRGSSIKGEDVVGHGHSTGSVCFAARQLPPRVAVLYQLHF